jgi:hypothetical protein
MDSTFREDDSTTTRESNSTIKESEMKFEMEFGLDNDKLIIESHDFEIIQIFQEFVRFQDAHGWGVIYKAVDMGDDDFEFTEVPTNDS